MKREEFKVLIILSLCVLALSTFQQVDAQTLPAGSKAQNRHSGGPKARFTSGDRALNIPLEIDNNIILMRVSVNGSKPLRFIFDTGASHSAINSKRAVELWLKTRGEASGTATGGRIRGSYVRGVSLSVLGAEVSNQLIVSIPLPTVPGFEFDGVIGYDFINQFVVEIDYLNKVMNLYDPRTYAYEGDEKAIPLLFDGGRIPFVLTKIVLEGRAPLKAKLGVDTGADGTFVMTSAFVKTQRLLAAIPNTVQDKGLGAGGQQRRVLGQVKAAHLGRFIMKDPPLALELENEGSGGKEGDGVVGGEIFRRFKVVLDYSRRRMILEPNKNFNEPYQLEVGG